MAMKGYLYGLPYSIYDGELFFANPFDAYGILKQLIAECNDDEKKKELELFLIRCAENLNTPTPTTMKGKQEALDEAYKNLEELTQKGKSCSHMESWISLLEQEIEKQASESEA